MNNNAPNHTQGTRPLQVMSTPLLRWYMQHYRQEPAPSQMFSAEDEGITLQRQQEYKARLEAIQQELNVAAQGPAARERERERVTQAGGGGQHDTNQRQDLAGLELDVHWTNAEAQKYQGTRRQG